MEDPVSVQVSKNGAAVFDACMTNVNPDTPRLNETMEMKCWKGEIHLPTKQPDGKNENCSVRAFAERHKPSHF